MTESIVTSHFSGGLFRPSSYLIVLSRRGDKGRHDEPGKENLDGH
jgi:hypothetical protein